MPTDFKEIEDSALQLDKTQRAVLAKHLLVSLEQQVDEDIEQAWIDEVKRRKQEIKSGKVSTIPAEQVLSKARKNIQR